MKKIFKKISKIIYILMMIIFYHNAYAIEEQKCIQPSDTNLLKTIAGDYILTNLFSNVKTSRNLPSSINTENTNHMISISKEGKVTFSYRWAKEENWQEIHKESDCIKIIERSTKTDVITFGEKGGLFYSYIRYKASSGEQLDYSKIFFNMLFNGCFIGTDKKKICFDESKIMIGGKWKNASIKMNTSDFINGGNVISVEGEKFYWFLVPGADFHTFPRKLTWKIYEAYEQEGIDLKTPFNELISE